MSRATGLAACVAVALVAAVAGTASSRELWRRGDAAVYFEGSVRQILRYTKQTSASDFGLAILTDQPRCSAQFTVGVPSGFANCSAFDFVGEEDVVQSLSRLRLDLEVEMTSWLSGVVIYDNEVFAGHIGTLEAGLAAERMTFLGAEGTVLEGENVSWKHRLYRGYLQLATERVEIIVGRQRIPWGVGRLWNPIDRFNPIGPLAIEADQSNGVDAIDAKWLFDGFSYLEAVFTPGSDSQQESYAFRLHGVLWDTDLSLMAGEFARAPTVGFDFARNLLDATVRAEVVYTHPEDIVWPVDELAPRKVDDFWQIVASVDYNFALGSGLYVIVEYLYNGNGLGFGRGKAGPLLPLFERTNSFLGVAATDGSLFGTSSVVTRSSHLLGLSLGSDLTPELRGDFLTIVDASGGSAAFFPSLRYSGLDFLELTLGAQVFAGPHLSEFGDASALVFLLAEIFF